MKIYLASSWRNPNQPEVLGALREAGHEVYDFRNPAPGNDGFSWLQLGLGSPKDWTPAEFRNVLEHRTSRSGFDLDMAALRAAEATVLLLPCGRSAHLELGYAVGSGQSTYVLFDKTLDEPELMYRMCSRLCTSQQELIRALDQSGRRTA